MPSIVAAVRDNGPLQSYTKEDNVLDASLIPSLLGRIESIIAKLQVTARRADSLAKERGCSKATKSETDANETTGAARVNEPSSTILEGQAWEGGEKGPRDPSDPPVSALGPPTSQRPAATLASDSLVTPSIALGGVSDDDHSLCDFLFFSTSHGLADSSASNGGQPTELSLQLLREARELRDTYRRAIKAGEALPAGEWAFDEQKQTIIELEKMRDIEMYQTKSIPLSQNFMKKSADDEEGSKELRTSLEYLPFGAEILAHLNLSSQVAHALFSCIQSAYWTVLPPSPVARPDNLPVQLRDLPMWHSKSADRAQRSPTPSVLIPSLVTIHNSLDELLICARTHCANAKRIEELQRQVQELRRRRVYRFKRLRKASSELRCILDEGQTELKKMRKASRSPLVYKDVLDYAADLGRVTSAPPGWADGVIQYSTLRDGVEGALKGSSAGPAEQKQRTATNETVGQSGGVDLSRDKAEEKCGHETDPASEPKPQASSSSSFLLHALRKQQGQGGHVVGEGSPAAASLSAPHSLPFPSDADMRRGLMGVAMLADLEYQQQNAQDNGSFPSSSTMKGLLPSWNEYHRVKKAEADNSARQAAQAQEALAKAQTATGAPQSGRHENVRGRDAAYRGEQTQIAEEDAGFGLDL